MASIFWRSVNCTAGVVVVLGAVEVALCVAAVVFGTGFEDGTVDADGGCVSALDALPGIITLHIDAKTSLGKSSNYAELFCRN